jgi:3-methyladenine DNA glycosylase AlkC
MADQLKTFFSPALVRRLAESIRSVHPTFDSKAFVWSATRGLDELELLDRGKHIATTLARHLPTDYAEAVAILLRSLGPAHETDELIGAGMAPFFYYPHTVFVAEHGFDHFDLSMQAQHELTRRFSAEGSIRPFIAHDPERTLAQLKAWTRDPNAHVRRLVSEGTRLRLPWAMRVSWLDQHPERVVELLELLKDDPATLVRRSVANNLNDLGKVHPALLAQTCERWLKDATPDRRALVEHALRSAVKRGDQRALQLLGYGRKPSVSIENVSFSPKRVSIGGRVTMTFDVRSTARVEQELLIDVAVHFVKASGKPSRKVFKLKRVKLAPRDRIELQLTVSLAVHTTRKPQPGKHNVDVIVNGSVFPGRAFEVTRAKMSKPR